MRLIRLLLISLVMFSMFATGCLVSSVMKMQSPSKPLQAAISCRENERIIVQVNKIKSPIVFDMEETKMTSPGLDIPVFNTFSFNYPYTYTYTFPTWVNVTPPTYKTEDYGPEFKRQHDNAFSYTNLQELLLSHIQKNLNTSSSCPYVYITSEDPKQFTFLPSDRVIQVVMTDHYYGRRPKLKSKIYWRLLTNTANIPIIENKEEEKREMLKTQMSTPTRKKLSYVKEILQKHNEILSYYDAYGTIVYDSPAYSRNAWFEDNGKLVKQETDKALDELARQLAIALFPGESGKEDESTRQGSASPPTATPQPTVLSLPQPQEPTEQGLDARGSISITSDPPGAKVFIDGEFKGQTPAEVSLTIGTHQIFLQRQLYEPYKDSVSIETGQTKTLNIRLSPEGKEKNEETLNHHIIADS